MNGKASNSYHSLRKILRCKILRRGAADEKARRSALPNARKTRLAATKKRVRTVPLQYTTIIEHCAPFFKGNAKVFLFFSRGERQLLPPRARKSVRAAPPSYIGLPQRSCGAKDFLGKGDAGIRALPRRRRGWRSLPCSDAGGEEKGGYSGSYSLSHDTEASFGCRDSSLKKAPIIRKKELRGGSSFRFLIANVIFPRTRGRCRRRRSP